MKQELSTRYTGIPLCGGRGSRIESIAQEQGGMPKPLLEVGGKKLIQYTTDLMREKYIPELIFTVGYKADEIRDWVNSASLPHSIKFAPQTGVGALSAILDAMPHVSQEKSIVSNTDEIRKNLNLQEALSFHERSGRLATLVAVFANNLSRHRTVHIRERDNLVLSTEKQPERYANHPEKIGLVNAGIIILNQGATDYADYNHDIDWSGLLDPLCDMNQLSVYTAVGINYFNVGTPEEYFEAESFLRFNSR